MRLLTTACLLVAACAAAAQESGPRLLTAVQPEIPAALRAEGVASGRVMVTAEVDASGHIVDCLATAATDPALIEPAVAAVRRWVFDPASLDDREGGKMILDFAVRFGAAPPEPEDLGAVDWKFQLPELRSLDRIPVPRHPVRPAFPADALAAGAAGEITVDFYVDGDGRVRMPSVIEGISPRLDRAALAAVAGWRFDPPLLHGQPTAVHSQQTFMVGGLRAHSRHPPIALRPPVKVAEYVLPGPLFGSAAVTDGKGIYLVGGQGSGYAIPYLLRFDLRTHEFTKLGQGKFIARVLGGAALVDGKIYIMGGTGQIGNIRRSVQIFDLATGTISDGPPLPSPRSNFALGAFGGRLIVAGGDVTAYGPTAETDVLDLRQGRWEAAARMPRPGTTRGTIIPYNGNLFVAGGVFRARFVWLVQRAVRIYNPNTGKWRRRRPLLGAVTPSAVEAVGRRVYIFGNYDDVVVYDLPTGYSAEYRVPPGNGFGAASACVGNRIYLIGGTLGPRLGLSSRIIQVFAVPP
ncbi:MAG TPA: TonB family protein [Opitutaceae bacterium]|jgi:TonB family protein|nr:TonB family protein [Opitutaceae bacterium]